MTAEIPQEPRIVTSKNKEIVQRQAQIQKHVQDIVAVSKVQELLTADSKLREQQAQQNKPSSGS